jgi:hypothetical protein
MKKLSVVLLISALTIFLVACDLNVNVTTPTDAPGMPTATTGATATAGSAYPWPSETGTCTLLTTEATVLYDRPSAEAQVFSEVDADFTAVVIGRTADGWVGFDPGVAQAANVGVFRMRWVHFDEVTLNGDCVSVPQAGWVPEPDLCYTMPMNNVTVYSGANTSSSTLATLDVEDFAAVIGYTSNGWAQVDLAPGNTGLTGLGWMQQDDLNLNGGTCDELPTVNP